ncbi:MAG: DUF6326 family protein [Candidatus Hodarchaeales archaeon]|jgi:hypothetical protein
MKRGIEMTTNLVDAKINVKIKLSALWVTMMLLYLYADVFGFYIPGYIEKIIAGEAPVGSQLSLLGAAILMVIPSVMVFLSLTLKAKANRWTNIIVGIVYTVVNILVNFLIELISLEPNAYYILIAIVEAVLTALIVWYAWKWPTQEG